MTDDLPLMFPGVTRVRRGGRIVSTPVAAAKYGRNGHVEPRDWPQRCTPWSQAFGFGWTWALGSLQFTIDVCCPFGGGIDLEYQMHRL